MSTVEKPKLSLLQTIDRDLGAIAGPMANKQQDIKLIQIDSNQKYIAFIAD